MSDGDRKEWDGRHVRRVTQIESWFSAEDKARHKLVRTDNGTDIDGNIQTANEATGECTISTASGESKTLTFGPGGIRIVERGRRG